MLSDIFKIKGLLKKVKMLEEQVYFLENELKVTKLVTSANLIRLKNKYFINDKAISNFNPYIDISAFQAYEIYHSNEHEFLLVDVENEEYDRPVTLDNTLKIPLDDLDHKIHEITSKSIPLFIISKDGIKSIDACEMLTGYGHFNCYNISGGYEKWPAYKVHGLGQKIEGNE